MDIIININDKFIEFIFLNTYSSNQKPEYKMIIYFEKIQRILLMYIYIKLKNEK